jgi:hypothetical protein
VNDGIIFYKSANHYKIENADGFSPAIADLTVHGNDEVGFKDYINDLIEAMTESGPLKDEAKIIKDIKTGMSTYSQVLSRTVHGGEPDTFALMLFRLPSSAAKMVIKESSTMELMNEVVFTDAKKGQDLMILREGTGFDTEYAVSRTGVQEPLDGMMPDWEDKMWKTPEAIRRAIRPNVMSREDQKAALQLAFGDRIDWERYEVEHGL